MEKINSFSDIEWHKKITLGLERIGYEKPTPIQAQSIVPIMKGEDLIGCAETGTGKTAAFSLPALSHLLHSSKSRALVLAPTRELAQQIEKHWQSLSHYCNNLNSVSVIGGSSYHLQLKKIARGPRIIFATPGRLFDLIENYNLTLDNVDYLVVDEADRMLDMGFAPQLKRIVKHLPEKRQTVLFSATWDKKIEEISKAFTKKAIKVSIGNLSRASTNVTQSAIPTAAAEKRSVLLEQLQTNQETTIVFTRTKRGSDQIARFLKQQGISSEAMHGDKSQGQRNRALKRFREGKCHVMIATDVASRGIDVKNIGRVINYELPTVPEDYVHRIGRTGRAGQKGQALSLVAPDEHIRWAKIVRFLQSSSSDIPDLEGFTLKSARKGGGGGRSSRRPVARRSRFKRGSRDRDENNGRERSFGSRSEGKNFSRKDSAKRNERNEGERPPRKRRSDSSERTFGGAKKASPFKKQESKGNRFRKAAKKPNSKFGRKAKSGGGRAASS